MDKEKKSIWHQNVSTNPRAKTIVLIVLGLIFVGLAILIWANQTGRISLWADTSPLTTTFNGLTVSRYCNTSNSTQTSRLSRTSKPTTEVNTFQVYKDGNWQNIGNCTNTTSAQCTWIQQYGAPNFRVIKGGSLSTVLAGPTRATACSGTTPTTTPTTTQCTSGQKKCDNLNYYGGTPCTCTTSGVWSCNKSPCGLTDSNKKCVNGACVTSTTPTTTTPTTPTTTSAQCTSAQKKCVGNTAYSTCSKSGTWGSAINCPTGTTCQGAGECVSTSPTPAPTTTSVSDCTQGWYGCAGDNPNTPGDNVYTCDAIAAIPGDPNSIYWLKTKSSVTCKDDGCREAYCGLNDPVIPTVSLTQNCDGASVKEVKLNFTSPVKTTYYKVYKNGSGGWIRFITPLNTDTWSDTNVPKDEVSEYKVEACNSTNKCSTASEIISSYSCSVTPSPTPIVTTSPVPTISPTPSPTPTIEPVEIPSSPQDFSAKAIDKDTINLSWLAPSDSEVAYYKIYSVNDSGALNAIEQFAPSNLSYEIKGLLCGTKYKYALSANNISGESDKVYVEATTGACDVVEESGIKDQKVGGLTGAYQNGGMITLTWDSVSGATGYSVYDCGGNQLTSTTNTSVVLTGLERDKDYCFYVIAHDNGGNLSQKSDEVTVNTTDYKVDEDSEPIGLSDSISISSLVSTGASLWFNILIALLLTFAIGYFMFRNKIHDNQ